MSKKKKKKDEFSFKEIRRIKRDDGIRIRCLRAYTFRDFVDAVGSRYSNRLCYTIYGGEDEVSFSYRYLAFKVHAISQYLLNLGIKKGDRICIYGESSPMWMMFYLGLTSIGGIAVPILPGFTGKEAIVAMEDSSCIGICSQANNFKGVREYVMEKGLHIFRLEDLMHITGDVSHLLDDKNFLTLPGVDITHAKFNMKTLSSLEVNEDDIASIIYTSGTTGSSKGVVLTHKNILSNADICSDAFLHIKPGARVLSILPMSHIYEFTVGQVLCMMDGCAITFLGKPPAVSILLPALKKVRPHIMLTVPLLIEKVYKAAVAPVLRDNKKISALYRNKLTRNFVCTVIGRKLKTTFGGKLRFFGVGGAALDPEVEDFLYRAKFPYAIGYGLTETSPMIAGSSKAFGGRKVGCAGFVIPHTDVKLLDMDKHGVGEIAVKGPQVTSGYYQNETLNAEAFTEDGYFRTGDLGVFDKKKHLAIKGRCKTMILGPAGENIYPESIESIINNQEFVQESLVVPENGGLLALIKIDIELMAKKLKISIDDANVEAKKYVEALRAKVNKELSKQNRIDTAQLQEEDFERTATQKIKRFLYPKKKDN